ncbi:sorting nexin-24-like [Mizuhopecten yessoensis]|uniref:sorting nexin-24-like n=1 Tax=Mizuhopecten yessoensis TaxID=6573 RepID=UPI000B45CED0|nr:sorting nexin-24-like [Mizuhopecten yessoensis]
MIRVTVPSFRKGGDNNDSYTVFNVEVCASGRLTNVEKRYSEFEDLHKQLKKIIRTPEFPPKKVMKWNPKVLEQRRIGLQVYLKGVVENEYISKSIQRFLCITLPVINNMEPLTQVDHDVSLAHQPMIGFQPDAFLLDNNKSSLHDIITEGVHRGLYCAQPEEPR